MTRSTRTIVALAAAAFLARCAGCGSNDEPSCPAGQTSCRDGCVDLATDLRNCGNCGNACAAGATCAAGSCACPAGQVVCNGACVDPATYLGDAANCGGCGIACGLGTCVAGTCDCGGFTSCGAQVPRCVDGLDDARNCGIGPAACGHACPLTNDVCDAGTCTCPAGTTACPVSAPTTCVDLQADEANCGACGTVCATGATCTSGTCQCPTNESPCGGVCVNAQTDETNCGTCGWVCPIGATCTTGACTCPSEQPRICGVPGAGGNCCAGNDCCANDACQTQHTNGTGIPGLGQAFFDCLPLGTYDVTQAEKAAQAWQPSGLAVPGLMLGCVSQACFAWQSGGACGTWCYGGTADPLRGRAVLVQSLVCVCPTAGTPNWN